MVAAEKYLGSINFMKIQWMYFGTQKHRNDHVQIFFVNPEQKGANFGYGYNLKITYSQREEAYGHKYCLM